MSIISIELNKGVPTEPGNYFVLEPGNVVPMFVAVKYCVGGFDTPLEYSGLIVGRSKLSDYVNAQWSGRLEFRATLEA
jgi:hypothetical protein